MYLEKLTLENYRNYLNEEITFDKGINLLLGQNGQGKTNLLEAVYYLSCANTFRGGKRVEELINIEKDYFHLSANLIKNRPFVLEVSANRQKKRQIKINNVPYKRGIDLLGYLKVVLFSPDDLKTVKGSPQERRRYLDLSLSQYDKSYGQALQKYQKVLLQRNSLLKEKNSANLEKSLATWDEQLVNYGSEIILKRLNYLKKIVPTARKIHAELSQNKERLNITYQSSLGKIADISLIDLKNLFFNTLIKQRKEEFLRTTSLFGPHRDDLIFYLNNLPLRIYGSQGQQRSFILALKMAEAKVFCADGDKPLMLLDDVLSELDDLRRKFLLDEIKNEQMQTIITAANMEFKEGNLPYNQAFEVSKGKIIKI